MGEVWAAQSDADGRKVAIKILLARAAVKPDLVRRFQREAKITSQIQSDFVCQLLRTCSCSSTSRASPWPSG
jgi:serine/threonine-protein kinase